MLIVVSPAKNLDYTSPYPTLENSQVRLDKELKTLVKKCKKLSPADLASLMKISDKLAILNAERFDSFEDEFTTENAKPAIFAFNGDVYAGIEASSLSQEDLKFAQSRLRILSGLYGVLKPLDLMQAYRLEMGTKLQVGKAENLYQFWGGKITKLLNEDLNSANSEVLVNLASNEYFSAVKKRQLNAQIITPHFKDEKNGKYKVISFFAKKARGMMARYIIQNRITEVEDLKGFDLGAYTFDESESTATDLVFKRKEQVK